MTDQISELLRGLALETKTYVAEVTSPLLAKIADLEQRLASIPAGPKGDPGERGEKGEVGSRGDTGLAGDKGETGEAGAQGDRGVEGLAGANGKDADEDAIVARVVALIPPPVNGKDGQPGKDATVDEDALVARVFALVPSPKDGEPGVKGEPGESIKGEPGTNGKDADEDAIVERVVKLIPVPQDGKAGEPGLNGKDFDSAEMYAAIVKAVDAIPRPKDGESIHPDTVAVMVREAVDKFAATIRIPKDGEPGRDALDLDIVDEVQEGRSYAFGTFAKYRGGVVKALRHTDPIEDGLEKSGWQIAVDGLDSFTVEQGEDLRTFTIRFAKTSGAVETKTFDLPVVIDRGVFQHGKTYKTGDAVTWGGSMHIAQKDTSATPGTPEAGGDWRLSVKRGRDGKDAVEMKQSGPVRLK